jgi:hypothetical protein
MTCTHWCCSCDAKCPVRVEEDKRKLQGAVSGWGATACAWSAGWWPTVGVDQFSGKMVGTSYPPIPPICPFEELQFIFEEEYKE